MLTKNLRVNKNKYKTDCYISGNNGRIEYIITAGDDNGDFEIVQNGTILTKHEVDRETKSSYNLVVTAKDCAREPETRLSSTVQVIIIVSIRHIGTYIFQNNFDIMKLESVCRYKYNIHMHCINKRDVHIISFKKTIVHRSSSL